MEMIFIIQKSIQNTHQKAILVWSFTTMPNSPSEAHSSLIWKNNVMFPLTHAFSVCKQHANVLNMSLTSWIATDPTC